MQIETNPRRIIPKTRICMKKGLHIMQIETELSQLEAVFHLTVYEERTAYNAD